MYTQTATRLQDRRLTTPVETPEERFRRERASYQVARQMLKNGCSVNDVTRNTGLTEEQLRRLSTTSRR